MKMPDMIYTVPLNYEDEQIHYLPQPNNFENQLRNPSGNL